MDLIGEKYLISQIFKKDLMICEKIPDFLPLFKPRADKKEIIGTQLIFHMKDKDEKRIIDMENIENNEF